MVNRIAIGIVAVLSLLSPMVFCETTLTGTITGYGSASNDPVGSNQVCCGLSGSEHSATYDDPGTCASDNSKYPVNTKIYIPGLQKYFIVQDSCADCVNQAVHFDLWMGPDSYTNYNNLLSCAESGGASDATIILDPNPGYTVDSTPLMDTNGKCDSNVDYSRNSPRSNGGAVDGSNPSSGVLDSQQAVSTAIATTMATSVAGVAGRPTGIVKGRIKVKATNTMTAVGGGSTGSVDGSSCDWEGHCKGASCQTYNDCGDPFSCINGVCT